MSEEMNREICKALAYKVPIEIIAENTGLSEAEIATFAAAHKSAIDEIIKHYAEMEG